MENSIMYEYRVLSGLLSPIRDGTPLCEIAEKPDTFVDLHDALTRLSVDGWEPLHFAIPTAYQVIGESTKAAPLTVVLRRPVAPSA